MDQAIVTGAAPFPLVAEAITRRGESETAVHALLKVQFAGVSVKLPVSEKLVVPEPLPTMALVGLMENEHPEAEAGEIVVRSLAEAGTDPPPLTLSWLVTCAGALSATFAVTEMGG